MLGLDLSASWQLRKRCKLPEGNGAHCIGRLATAHLRVLMQQHQSMTATRSAMKMLLGMQVLPRTKPAADRPTQQAAATEATGVPVGPAGPDPAAEAEAEQAATARAASEPTVKDEL